MEQSNISGKIGFAVIEQKTGIGIIQIGALDHPIIIRVFRQEVYRKPPFCNQIEGIQRFNDIACPSHIVMFQFDVKHPGRDQIISFRNLIQRSVKTDSRIIPVSFLRGLNGAFQDIDTVITGRVISDFFHIIPV